MKRFFLFFSIFFIVAHPVYAGAVLEGEKPWPNGVIHYRIDPVILARVQAKGRDCTDWKVWPENTQAAQACKAMDEWHQATGVVFAASTIDRADDLLVRDGKATTARLGYNELSNPLTIMPDDVYGTVLHEFGHALGLMHEHSRPDRDDYLTLSPFLTNTIATCEATQPVCRNIKLSYIKAGPLLIQTEFDPCSIMLYKADQTSARHTDQNWSNTYVLTAKGEKAFAACSTQLPRDCKYSGQKCIVSEMDALAVRRFYGTAK